jgi:hypothetical protein
MWMLGTVGLVLATGFKLFNTFSLLLVVLISKQKDVSGQNNASFVFSCCCKLVLSLIYL